MVYFPPEIFRIIYSYDATYKNIYKECIQEMTSIFNYNRCICLLNSLFYKTHYGNLSTYHEIYSKNTLAQYVRNHAKRFKHICFTDVLDHYRAIYNQITCCRYCRSVKGRLYVKNYRSKKIELLFHQ